QAAGSGTWSLALTLLAAVAGAWRIVSLGSYLHDPHLIKVGLAELLILLAAVASAPGMSKRRPTQRRTQDMPFQPPPRPAPVLASVLAAGLMLTAASCSHLTPLGPAAPQPHHLRSPIVLQAMRVQNPTPAGGCPAG